MKEWNPTVVFDRAEEIASGNLMIHHATDAATQVVKYYASVDRPHLDVICASTPVETLRQAEQVIAICLSLRDRNDI
jgi:hypothetical protein